MLSVSAASFEDCVELKESQIGKVCVGDLVRDQVRSQSGKELVQGEVIAIEAGVYIDGKEVSLLTVQTDKGTKKITTGGFILMTPGTCIIHQGQEICIDDEYKSELDGSNYEVLGFAENDGYGYKSYGVYVLDTSSAEPYNRSVVSAASILESLAVAKTGIFKRVASCDSEVPFLDKIGYGTLPNCAKRRVKNKIKRACERYCGGEVDQAGLDSLGKPECEVVPNLIPPHRKVCTLKAQAMCRCPTLF